MKRICRICGQEFETKNGRQLDCNKIIWKKCAVCGNEFESRCSKNHVQVTCSAECTNIYAASQRTKAYQKTTKICKLCGQEFHPKTNTQTVCERRHMQKCIVCGEEFDLKYDSAKGTTDLRKTCSDECLHIWMKQNNPFRDPRIREKIKNTMKDKYGVEFAAQSPEFLEKQKTTTRERYGVDYFAQSDLYKEVAEKTNVERYGTAWPLQNSEVKDKLKQTVLSRYNVSNVMLDPAVKNKLFSNYKETTGYDAPMQNPEVKQKSKDTCISKYGVEYYAQTPEYRDKVEATNLQKFGVKNAMQNKDIREKAAQTCRERYNADCYLASPEGRKKASERMIELYGKEHYSQTEEWKVDHMTQCDNIDLWMEFVQDPEQYINKYFDNKPTYRKVACQIGVPIGAVNDISIRHKLQHLFSRSSSYMEEELAEFLDEMSVEYEMHNRKLIPPYELDFYIPEYKVGIECNPTGTHNSSVPYVNEDWSSIIPPRYHKMKTDMCEKEGIFLFHIFGYEWAHNKPIILSMISNILHRNNRTIYARKCQFKEVDNADAMYFLSLNHRQGAINSSVRLGLYYNDELVSLMTFGNLRRTIGKDIQQENSWELLRFCNALNTSVVGGASKLFAHFIEEFHPQLIRSFSDRAHTSGNLYPMLGLRKISTSDPGYMWVDLKTNKGYSRINAQKQNIKKFLKDEDVDLTKSEKEIMIEHGFVQVFDSGIITWEWTS